MSTVSHKPVTYDRPIEEALATIGHLLHHDYRLSKRAIALLLLQGDEEIADLVRRREGPRFWDIGRVVRDVERLYDRPLAYVVSCRRQEASRHIVGRVVLARRGGRRTVADALSNIMMHPASGMLILLLVVYYGLYRFVGVFGAGTVVDFLEGAVFEARINPFVEALVADYVPFPALQDLLAGEYGVVTLGFRYAVAIILPIVGTFFLVFAVIEDTGYLPRLALLVDRVFKTIGLNGRAVIPMTLGLGCDTMATIVSRTLETRRERVIATLLLALAVPCSAQLGVILALLSFHPGALLVWAGVISLVFLLVGFLSARLLPGAGPSFYMEVPPLRWPRLANVLTKTWTRMNWYFMEVFPLFILASFLIWLGRLTGAFDAVVGVLVPLVQALGLPGEAAVAFLFGFFRRDYGAAGLYDLQAVMTGQQMVVAAVTLTLFIPCIAQFSVMVKERGLTTALAIAAFILPLAFGAGYLLNTVLTWLPVTL